MNTIISNRIWVRNASIDLIQYCRENLIIPNPKYETLMKIGKEDEIRRCHIKPTMSLYVENVLDLIIPFGCLRAIWKYIKNSPVEIKFNTDKKLTFTNDTITQPLFDYQEEAVQKMVNAKGGVLVAPCSAGKTNMMIEVIKRLGLKFLFIVHTSDLLRQFYNRAKSLYPNMDLGKITEGKIEIGRDGAVATVQTLDMIDKDYYANEFGCVVVDECVHVNGSPTLSKMFSRVLNNIPARYKFGCTATPERSDKTEKSMYAILGTNLDGEYAPVHIISRSCTRSLTANHIRVDTHVPFLHETLDDDGTFNYSKLLDFLSTNPQRNELIVNLAKNEHELGHKTLILCHRVEQCETLNQMLLDNGVKSCTLLGKITNKKREAILNETTEWETIVATLSLAKEGLDLPCLNTLILATPVNDKGMTIQCAGRVERYKEGKETPNIYDLCDEKYPYCVNRFKKRVGYLKKRV